MTKGLLIVYSGPSGVGKSTILEKVLQNKELNLAFSISMTTRLPRGNEKEGVDYFFVDTPTFEKAIEDDKFLEHARYVEHYYGTPKDYVEKMRNEGKNVILEIDVQGAKQVVEKCPEAISIFVCPPSLDILKNRLTGRGTESIDVVNKRLAQAEGEINASSFYKYHITNVDVDKAVESVVNIIQNEMNK